MSASRDRGAQAERTGLAWERTAAALGTAAIVIGRITAERLGAVALVLAGAGALGCVLLLVRGRRRGARWGAALTGGHPGPSGDAVLVAAGVVMLLAGLEVARLLLGP
ncbi:DUF202 domain-containing protein [Pseudonocardia nigra]|uniref:DUF202 domain-containing protein n=1 Tax=Pseudonocardia nigra TaxID=1921578 RepID=UPI001C5E21E0|nr:DUF202 domain-containing protein [Pseudonocardia nigra]